VLEALDLRDNQFKALPSLQAFAALQSLEISYNEVGGEGGRPRAAGGELEPGCTSVVVVIL
jgi:hypothetical protein